MSTEHGAPHRAEPRTGWLDRRMGWDGARVVGVDVARGLALLGMFGAHLHVRRDVVVADPSTWLGLVHGRSAILFALLAGVSLAIVSGGTAPVGGRALVALRLRTLVRAALLFALGSLLILAQTPIGIILEFYAVLFVLAIPVLHWGLRRLVVLAAVLAVVGPLVTYLAATAIERATDNPPMLARLLFTGQYPTATWFTFVVAGLAVGRLALHNSRVATRLLAAGASLAVVGYTAGHLAGEAAGAPSLVFGNPSPGSEGYLDAVLDGLPTLATADPHTGTPFEVLGSTGFAIAVLAVCLLLTRGAGRYPLLPLAAAGSMPLSVYCGHVLAYWIWLDAITSSTSLRYYAWFVAAALVAVTAWRLALGKGPLERGIAWVAGWAVRGLDRGGAPAPDPAPAPGREG